jgi:hypothetical protein
MNPILKTTTPEERKLIKEVMEKAYSNKLKEVKQNGDIERRSTGI